MAAGNYAQSRPMVPSASAALKKLRQRTGLSVGAVAAALGRPKSSYAHFDQVTAKAARAVLELADAFKAAREAGQP